MKKKVRIYKAPDGKGKFVNKTAKFLHKAQEGGQQDQQAQITDYVYKTLANTDELDMEMMKDTLIGELVSAKIPMDQAEQIVENIAANFESQEPVQEQEEEMDVYDEGLAELQRQQEEAEEERLAALSEDYGYYDDTAADGEDDEDDDDDIPEEIYMQQGGDIIPEDNAVSFTGYYPFQYNRDKQTSYQQGGITKRKYIGQVMKLLKKQAGGEEEKPSAGFDPTDTMDNKKKNKNDNFVAALANSAQEAKMKEQAEAMWEQQQQQMMQQQAPMQQQQFAQNGAEIGGGDIIYGATEEEKEEWRRNNGPNYYPEMSISQARRMSPRGFSRNQMRSFAGMVPQGGFFPMGMNIMTYPQMVMPEQKPIHVQGTLPGMKLDVRKSHWLTGRPSQYSIEFGGDFAIPGFNMMPGKGYGYKSSNRKTIEGVSRLVNKAADPEKKVIDPVTGDKKVVLTTSGTYNMDAPSGTITTVDAQGNEVSKYVPELDLGNKSVDNANPNKNVVGKGPNVPTKTQTKKTVTATKSKQAGQTKPAASSAKVTNKGKATVTSSDLINKQKKSGWSNSVTGPGAGSSTYDFVPNWMKSVVDNNRARDAENEKLLDYFLNSKSPLLKQQSGGFVDSSNPDLYKFVYGGDDVITQQDMNYSDSRNTGSPFFAHGGLVHYQKKGEVTEYDKDGNGVPDLVERTPSKNPEEKKEEKKKDEPKKPEFQAITSKEDYDKRLAEERKKWQEDYTKQNQSSDDVGGYDPYGGYVRRSYRPNAFGRYFPANTVRRLGTWSQQQGMPYNPMTGAGYFGGFGPGTQLTKIDVRKSGWLSGRPKKYTMYFNNAEMDPTKPQFSINTGAGASSDAESVSESAANKKAKNAKEFFGYTDAEWDKMSDKEKKQEKVNMKRQKYWESLPDPETTNNNVEIITTDTVSSDNPYKQDAAAAARGEGLFDPNSVNIPSNFFNSFSGNPFEVINTGVSGAQKLTAFPTGDIRGDYMKSQLTLPPPAVPLPQEMPADFPANTSGPRVTEEDQMAYGGNTNLNRFVYGDEVTKTSTGTDSPVVYTNNPALEGLRDVDLVGSNTAGITNLQSPSFWSDQQSFNQPTMDFQTGCTEEEKKDPKSACYDMEKYGMKVQEDALGSARETTEKRYAPEAGEFAVDFKNKDTYEVDAQGMLLSGNAGARGILDFFERRAEKRRNKNFNDRFTADNLYASDPSRDRGDYDTNTGLYRPNEQGQIWNSRSKQLGGFMQEGGYVEGDVVDMTPEEIEEFIANGGEVEIIS